MDNGICDFNSENPFSSNALLEKLRDDFCDQDTEIENDDEKNDDERRDQIRDAEDADDDQGNDEDDQGNDEDDQGIGESDKLLIQDRIQNRLQELKEV